MEINNKAVISINEQVLAIRWTALHKQTKDVHGLAKASLCYLTPVQDVNALYNVLLQSITGLPLDVFFQRQV